MRNQTKAVLIGLLAGTILTTPFQATAFSKRGKKSFRLARAVPARPVPDNWDPVPTGWRLADDPVPDGWIPDEQEMADPVPNGWIPVSDDDRNAPIPNDWIPVDEETDDPIPDGWLSVDEEAANPIPDNWRPVYFKSDLTASKNSIRFSKSR